jgi:hypothetical protein
VIAALPLMVSLWACADAPELPDGVRLLGLDDPQTHWQRDGVVPMVPPAHHPSAMRDRDAVTVYVEIPDDGALSLVQRSDGRDVLSWPAGTVADRVERWGPAGSDRVVDVRGTRIDADGKRWHHVYRPTDTDADSPLLGAEWPADDPERAVAAIDAFLDALAESPLVRRQADPAAYVSGVRGKLDCDGCHQPLRPDNERHAQHGLVNRGTDAAGFFTPSTVLHDEVPLERYGTWDRNLEAPFLEVRCAGATPTLPAATEGAHPSCPDRVVPTAHYALDDALRADQPHARAVCASWRHLASHIDPDGLDADHPCAREL